jgi:hypothetical protein
MITLLAQAQSAGLALRIAEDGRLLITGPVEAEPVARQLLAQKEYVVTALTVLGLAHSYRWGVHVIVGGGRRGRSLILGEVVGGNESRWRMFVERASVAQLREARALTLASRSAV